MDYLSYLQNPNVPDEDKARLLQYLQKGNEKMDWPTTLIALATDAAAGHFGMEAVNKSKWGGSWGDKMKTLGPEGFLGKRGFTPEKYRNVIGMLGGGGAGLLGGMAYKHLANYFNPYGDQDGTQ